MNQWDAVPGGQELAAQQERQALSRTLSCLGLGLLVFLLSARGVSLGILMIQRTMAARGEYFSPEMIQVLNLCVYLLSLLLPILLLIGLLRRPAGSLMPMALPHPRFLFPALGLSLGVAAGANLLSTLLLHFLQQSTGLDLPVYTSQFAEGTLPLLLSFLSSALAPAILEELLFRGIVLHSLRPFGDRFAVVVSSVLFALCHTTVGQWLPALVIGLCLGCFVVRSGSVVTSMVIHFVYNLMVTLVSMGGYFGGERHQLLGTLLMLVVSLVACLVSYLVLSGRYGAIFALKPQPSALSGGRRAVAVLTNLPILLAAATLLYTTLSAVLGGAG